VSPIVSSIDWLLQGEKVESVILILSERWLLKYGDDGNAEYKYQISLTTGIFIVS